MFDVIEKFFQNCIHTFSKDLLCCKLGFCTFKPFRLCPPSTAAYHEISMIVTVMTRYILWGDDQVEPDSKTTGDFLLAGSLSSSSGTFGPINSGLCS